MAETGPRAASHNHGMAKQGDALFLAGASGFQDRCTWCAAWCHRTEDGQDAPPHGRAPTKRRSIPPLGLMAELSAVANMSTTRWMSSLSIPILAIATADHPTAIRPKATGCLPAPWLPMGRGGVEATRLCPTDGQSARTETPPSCRLRDLRWRHPREVGF